MDIYEDGYIADLNLAILILNTSQSLYMIILCDWGFQDKDLEVGGEFCLYKLGIRYSPIL